jgi:hypothetical protein
MLQFVPMQIDDIRLVFGSTILMFIGVLIGYAAALSVAHHQQAPCAAQLDAAWKQYREELKGHGVVINEGSGWATSTLR